MGKTRKAAEKLSVLDLETQSIELLEILKSNASLNYRRNLYFDFFHRPFWSTGQIQPRSYYIEFAEYLSGFADGLASTDWDPQKSKRFLASHVNSKGTTVLAGTPAQMIKFSAKSKSQLR